MSVPLEIAKDVLKAVIPEIEAGEPPHVYRWRQTVAIFLIGGTILMSFHVAWVCGWLSFMGIQGLAQASELQSFEQKFIDFRATQLEQQIIDGQKSVCLALAQNNQTALDYQNQDLREKRAEYYNVTRRAFDLPTCSQLIVSQPPVQSAPQIPLSPQPGGRNGR